MSRKLNEESYGIMPVFLYMWLPCTFTMKYMDCSFVGSSRSTNQDRIYITSVAGHYAMAVKKHSGEIVGHQPRKISGLCSMLIDQLQGEDIAL